MVIRKYHHKFGVLRGRAPATAHTDVSPSRRRPDNSNGLSENRPHGKLPDSRTNGNRLSATCQAGLCDRPPAARKVPYSVSQGGRVPGGRGGRAPLPMPPQRPPKGSPRQEESGADPDIRGCASAFTPKAGIVRSTARSRTGPARTRCRRAASGASGLAERKAA